MLARRLMGRMRGRQADPFDVGPVSHVNPRADTSNRAWAFNTVPKIGSPTVVQVPGGELQPLRQVPYGSRTRGTITLVGHDLVGEDLQPKFGSTARLAAIFRCSPAGMAEEPLEVLPYPLTATSSTTWNIVWHDYAIAAADVTVAGASHQAFNMRTGATATLETPRSMSSQVWRNLGHAALFMPTQNYGGFTGIFYEHGPGMLRTRTFSAAQGPTTIFHLQLNPQPADNSRTFAYIAQDAHSIAEHDISLDVDMAALPGTLVHRVKEWRTLSSRERWQGVRNGMYYVPVEVRIWEAWRSDEGAPITRDESGYRHTLHPCILTQRIVQQVGLMRISADGSKTFVPWTDKRMLKATLAFHFRGEGMVIATGVTSDSDVEWYYRRSGSSIADWAARTNFAETETVLNDPAPPSPSASFCLSDRIAAGGQGVWRFWAYDGNWLGDAAYPSGASPTGSFVGSIAGEDVLICANWYSRDLGATWQTLASPTPNSEYLVPVRLY